MNPSLISTREPFTQPADTAGKRTRRLARPWRLLIAFASWTGVGCAPLHAGTAAPAMVPHGGDPVREVRTLAIVDPLWIWGEESARDVVHDVSADWSERFGIRFRVIETRGESIPGLTAREQMRELARKIPLTADIDLVVYFTRSTGLLWPEMSELLGNYLVVAPGLWDSSPHLLAHGLGHIFGAGHTVYPLEVMSPTMVPFVSRAQLSYFSAGTSSTIASNKWRSFARRHALRVASAR